MHKLKKTLDELEQAPGARAEGHMFGTLTIGDQANPFTANYVYVDLQHKALRFFGNQVDAEKPDKWATLQVQLLPESIGSGTYKVGDPAVKNIIYVGTERGEEYIAERGEVAFNRSTSLERLLGTIEAEFVIEGKLAVMRCQYDIRGWGIK